MTKQYRINFIFGTRDSSVGGLCNFIYNIPAVQIEWLLCAVYIVHENKHIQANTYCLRTACFKREETQFIRVKFGFGVTDIKRGDTKSILILVVPIHNLIGIEVRHLSKNNWCVICETHCRLDAE
jgi:hypothetical protein